MKKWTVTRRYDNVVVATGIERYFDALAICDKFPKVDHIIHEDGTNWIEEKFKVGHDMVQESFAYL